MHDTHERRKKAFPTEFPTTAYSKLIKLHTSVLSMCQQQGKQGEQEGLGAFVQFL